MSGCSYSVSCPTPHTPVSGAESTLWECANASVTMALFTLLLFVVLVIGAQTIRLFLMWLVLR